LVSDFIPSGSRVLDLGCSDGTLLAHLFENKGCRGSGVEIDPDAVLEAIRRGVPVVELDMDAELDAFGTDTYDVVVLSRTIQTLRRPEAVLRQMARIGRKLIVSAPNFGWWGNRITVIRGHMPISKDLPYEWFNSPNIRFTTLVDLQKLFEACELQVEQAIPLSPHGNPLRLRAKAANLLAGAAVYLLKPNPTGNLGHPSLG
jgi:methionine biosynthesis protein MetW